MSLATPTVWHDMFEADELSDQLAFINEGRIVALDAEDSSARLATFAASPDLMTIHTEEATLEHIFIELTGRGLEG